MRQFVANLIGWHQICTKRLSCVILLGDLFSKDSLVCLSLCFFVVSLISSGVSLLISSYCSFFIPFPLGQRRSSSRGGEGYV